MIAGAIGGKPTTPTPGLVASTGSEFLSSLPKLGIVSVPNGASVIYLKSRGNLRIQAVEGPRKTVIVNEKVDDFDDKFNNGHAGNSVIFPFLCWLFLFFIFFFFFWVASCLVDEKVWVFIFLKKLKFT